MKHSTYPYAPLTPSTAASRLHLEAMSYGINVGLEAGGPPSEKTELLAERTVALASRVHLDAIRLEQGPRQPVVTQ